MIKNTAIFLFPLIAVLISLSAAHAGEVNLYGVSTYRSTSSYYKGDLTYHSNIESFNAEVNQDTKIYPNFTIHNVWDGKTLFENLMEDEGLALNPFKIRLLATLYSTEGIDSIADRRYIERTIQYVATANGWCYRLDSNAISGPGEFNYYYSKEEAVRNFLGFYGAYSDSGELSFSLGDVYAFDGDVNIGYKFQIVVEELSNKEYFGSINYMSPVLQATVNNDTVYPACTVEVDEALNMLEEVRLDLTDTTFVSSIKIYDNTTGELLKDVSRDTDSQGRLLLPIVNPYHYQLTLKDIPFNKSGSGQLKISVSDFESSVDYLQDVTMPSASVSSLSISGPSVVAESATHKFTCLATYSDGTQGDVTNLVTWSDSSSYANFVSSGYLFTSAVSSNTSCTVSASLSGKSASFSTTITNVAVSLTLISVEGPAEIGEGVTWGYNCFAHYSDGTKADVTSSAIWSESSPYIQVNSDGLVTAGQVTQDVSATVSAAYGGKSASRSLTVKNTGSTITTIIITGDSSVNESGQKQYKCSAIYDDDSSVDVTPYATWNTSNNAVSQIDDGLLVTQAVSSNQSLTISAVYMNLSASKIVTVVNVPATLTGVEIEGQDDLNERSTGIYVCNAVYSDGTRTDVTSSSVWSLVSAYAELTSGGTVQTGTVVKSEPFTLNASWGGRSASKNVNVNNLPPLLHSLRIGGPGVLNKSTTTPFTCFAYSVVDDYMVYEVVTPTWTLNSADASVSANGQVTTANVLNDVTVTLTATYRGISTSRQITISTGYTPQILEAMTSGTWTRWGWSTAASGNWMASCSYNYDLIFYQNVNGTWTKRSQPPYPSGYSAFAFGYSLAMSGDYAVVGAYMGTSAGASQAGKAFIYKRLGTEWSLHTVLESPSPTSSGHFGKTLDISGGHIIVGTDQDMAYIYSLTGGEWELSSSIAPPVPDPGLFGMSVAISSEYAVVGSPLERSDDNYDIHSAFVYRYTNGRWVYDSIIRDPDDNYAVGRTASLDGNHIILGRGSGYVSSFILKDGRWEFEENISMAVSGFGRKFDVSSNCLVITADYEDIGGASSAGKAYVYFHDGSGWSQVASLQPATPVDDGNFGYSVAVSGGNVFVGAWEYGTDHNGQVHVYDINSSDYDSDSDGMPDDWESAVFGSLGQSGTGDHDGDGLTNLEEFAAGTSPLLWDTEGDSMPDGWEDAYGLDPFSDDSGLDPDGDSMTNIQEYMRGTNPGLADSDGDGVNDNTDDLPGESGETLDTDGDGVGNNADTDDDNDGMPDAWEVQYSLDPLVNDAGLDADNDGVSNLHEYLNGTVPFGGSGSTANIIPMLQLLLFSGGESLPIEDYFPLHTSVVYFIETKTIVTGSLNYFSTGIPSQFTTPGLLRQRRIYGGQETGGNIYKYVDGVLYQYGNIWADGTYCRFNSPQPIGKCFVPGEARSLSFTRTDYNANGNTQGSGTDTYVIQTEGPISITVPAGTYSAYKATVTDNWTDAWGGSGVDVFQYWLVEGLGIVRLDLFLDEDDTSMNLERIE
jgi:hypothetical protein